jgi:pimeloyl-ACP methyl ester carboxylesterase
VWGEEDVVFPAPTAFVAAAAMPRGRAVILPGLGHSPHLEDPEQVLAVVEGFLSGRACLRSLPAACVYGASM